MWKYHSVFCREYGNISIVGIDSKSIGGISFKKI